MTLRTLLLAVYALAVLAPAPARSEPAAVAMGVGSYPISFTHASSWFVERGDNETKRLSLIVYFEGSPGWHGKTTNFTWQTEKSPATIDMTVGKTPIHVSFKSETDEIVILGTRFDRAKANVFLVTGVDAVRPTVRAIGVHDLVFAAGDNPAVVLLTREFDVRVAIVGDTALVRSLTRVKPVAAPELVAWDDEGLRLTRSGEAADAERACALFRRAAERGYAPAQYRLGYCYESGRGAAKDEAEANTWYEKAAQQGHIDAQYKLGHSYRVGRGTAVNLAASRRWYAAAAAQGDVDACENLGLMCAQGQGGAADPKAAMEWYRKGAELGSFACQFEVARRLSAGDGLEQDVAAAYAWVLVLMAQLDSTDPAARESVMTLAKSTEGSLDAAGRAQAEARSSELMRMIAQREVARLGR